MRVVVVSHDIEVLNLDDDLGGSEDIWSLLRCRIDLEYVGEPVFPSYRRRSLSLVQLS